MNESVQQYETMAAAAASEKGIAVESFNMSEAADTFKPSSGTQSQGEEHAGLSDREWFMTRGKLFRAARLGLNREVDQMQARLAVDLRDPNQNTVLIVAGKRNTTTTCSSPYLLILYCLYFVWDYSITE